MAIFTLAGSAIATAVGLGATAASFISAGLAVGANLALSYFTRQKQTPVTAQARTAIAQQVQFGADVARFTVYGTSAVKGHLHFYGKWGEGNAYNGFVYKLADGWCDGLDPVVFFYGERHVLVGAPTIGGETERWLVSGYDDLIEFRVYDGRPGQAADAKLVADTASGDRRWLSTSRMTNQAYVVVQTRYDKDRFSRGRPEFTWLLRGLRAYDWRKDGSVAGGVGPHRLGDPTTWEHTNNAAILRAAFQMGLQGAASGRTLIGQGKSFAQLHLPSYTIAANVGDTDRTKNGRTFKTYQIGMIVSSDMAHTEVLSDFDDAMAGYAFNAGGLSGVIVGAPQIPAFTITAKDIRVDGRKTMRWRRETDDLFNHLTGTFLSPESHWASEPLKPVTVAADVAADKRKRSQPYDFTQVFDPDVAQYLLNMRYRQGRYGGQATLPVMPRLYRTAEAGDWCLWAGKTWIVMGKDSQSGGPALTLAETAADVYDEAGIAVGPIISAPTVPAQALAPVVANLAVTADVVAGEQDIPALRVTWTPSDDPRIDAVLVEHRIQGQTDAQRVRDDSPSDGVHLITGLAGGADYEVRAAYVTDPPLTTVFTPWVGVSTGTVPVVVPDEAVTLTKLGLDVQGLVAQIQSLQGQLEQIAAASANSGSLEMLRRSDADGELRAVVSRLGEDTQALVAEETTARTSAVDALAARSLLVQAALGEAEATGLMKVESSVSPDGLTTSFSFFARATLNDAFEEAGMIIEVVSDGGTPPTLTSRVAFVADKFQFDNGSQPFTVTAEGVFLEDMFFKRLQSSPAITTHSIDINAETGRFVMSTAP